MTADARTQTRIRTDARARLIFGVLASVLPTVLALLFARQESRLRALADHGAASVATVTRRTSDGTFYRYEVGGQTYTWNVHAREAPFSPGTTFDITYLPEDPSLSRPGRYGPERFVAERNVAVTRGLPIGLFVFFGGAAWLCHRNVRRLRRGEPERERRALSPDAVGRVVALLFVACMLGVNLDPAVRAKHAQAFGAAPFGLPVALVVTLVELVLFAPYFWVFAHLMRIVMPAQARGGVLSKGGVVLAVASAPPELLRSRRIVIAGLVWFVLIVGAWIAYADARGI